MKHSASKRRTTLPTDELINSIRHLSAKAHHLLMYYYTKFDGWTFDDLNIAKEIGLPNERAVKKYRKELIDSGYLYITGKNPTIYFVGKASVLDFKDNNIRSNDE